MPVFTMILHKKITKRQKRKYSKENVKNDFYIYDTVSLTHRVCR